jgi:integrase
LPALSPVAANSYLNNLSALFNWAVKERYLEWNPAVGLQVAKPTAGRKSRKRPFDIAQLKAIFAAPLYTGCIDDQRGYAEPGPNRPRRGRFWVPLLSLWTGMRLNECCQLLVNDLRVLDGTECIVIHEAGDDDGGEADKRVKTAAGERYVPIHPELKRIGFMEYVTAMREGGQSRLFPDLPRGANGYYSDPFQKWFGRFLKAGAAKPKTSFHSFPHAYRDALREANISQERARALGGWAGNGTADQLYGDGLRPSTLAKEVAKISYPGLDLSHLHLQPVAKYPSPTVTSG